MQRTAGYSHNAMAVISYKVRFNISEGVLKLIASSAAINFFLREEVEASTSETRETASQGKWGKAERFSFAAKVPFFYFIVPSSPSEAPSFFQN